MTCWVAWQVSRDSVNANAICLGLLSRDQCCAWCLAVIQVSTTGFCLMVAWLKERSDEGRPPIRVSGLCPKNEHSG